YTAPSSNASGIVKCVVTDGCGRKKIVSSVVNVITGLPVSLVRFSAKENNGSVLLEWATASELNNDYFMIEKSTASKMLTDNSWRNIGRVSGAGNSTAMHAYNYTDDEPLAGAAYYRLKQVDYDGKSTYSPVQFVKTSIINK